MHLIPCPSCERHVRASDAHCPFCSGSMPHKASVTARALGLRAAMFFGASAAVVACGGDKSCHDEEPCSSSSSSSSSSGAPVAVYGAPAPIDAGTDAPSDAAAAADAAVDAPSEASVAAYGAPGP